MSKDGRHASNTETACKKKPETVFMQSRTIRHLRAAYIRKEILFEKQYVLLSSYTNTRESLEELEKAQETALSVFVPTAFLVLGHALNRNNVHV